MLGCVVERWGVGFVEGVMLCSVRIGEDGWVAVDDDDDDDDVDDSLLFYQRNNG